jgi:AmmeMemoRadiSam system protein B
MAFLVGACTPVVDRSLRIENKDLSMDELASDAEVTEETSGSMISGIIMPHHELAREMIESAWQESLKVEPDLIILMGPDHPGLASYPLIWTEETESQVAFVCSTISKEWIRDGVGGVAIIADHSIETPLKFLQETGNKIPVLAITLPRGMEVEEINRFLERIQELEGDRLGSGNHLLLVGSVDFSHGLASEESKKKDAESFAWIQERDLDAIRSASNAYFDSPETIEVLLRCIGGKPKQINRSDSSDFGWSEVLSGTSYQKIRLYE